MTFGIVLAAPVILYQLWLFLSPALHTARKARRHRRAVRGNPAVHRRRSLAFFVVVPLALPWLFDFGTTSMIPLITAEEYFSFVFTMVLTFGVSFELPIVVLALSALGIVTPQLLSKYRRHAVVIIVIVGAFLTPGDLVWTTLALAVPLYGLYELSVAASYVIYKRKQRRRARLDAEQAKEAEHSEATA